MATSNQKLAALRPEVMAMMEEALATTPGLGSLVQLATASLRPLIDGQIDTQLARPADDLDAILAQWARTLAGLRSDGAAVLELGPVALPQLDPNTV